MSDNEIALRNPSPSFDVGVDPLKLIRWADGADAAWKLAERLASTPFAGSYKGDVGGACAAILKGAEVGLTPVTSLGAFDLINGTPAPKAITLRALLQSHGHRVWVEVVSDDEVRAYAVRRGEDQNKPHLSVWTMKRARDLGIARKDNWIKQPTAMLIARATAEVCRLCASDVILGIGYSFEELQDQEPGATVRVSRDELENEPKVATARKGKAKAIENAQSVEEPGFDDEDQVSDPPILCADGHDPIAFDSSEDLDKHNREVHVEEPPIDEGITKAQMGMMGALLTKIGIPTPEAARAYCGDVIGRQIASRKDLKKHEASLIIESLKKDEAELDGKKATSATDPVAGGETPTQTAEQQAAYQRMLAEEARESGADEEPPLD